MPVDRSQIKALLDPLGATVVYGYLDENADASRPYIVINYLYSDDLGADNQNWCSYDRWQVDLITTRRNEKLENELESTFKNEGLFFYKTQDIDPATNTVRMIYRFTTIGD